MNIEINDKTEELLTELIASGRYGSVDEIIADAAQRLPAVPGLPEHIEIDALAAEQGVEPISDFHTLRADFYPAGETTEQFLSFLHNDRESDEPRMG